MTLAVSIAQSGANNVTMRNRIINGGMMIDQRNAGASVTVTGDGIYGVDRFVCSKGGSTNNLTMQQSTTAPTGFKNSLLLTAGTGVAVGSTNYAAMGQIVEGLNIADFNLGTSSSVPFTLSFWVRSSLTGTFGVSFRNSAAQATYCATYTISSANTFEFKTVTIPAGAINSGTWLTTNGAGVGVFWDLGVGSTYSGTANQLNTGANYFGVTGTTKLTETTGATFYITGVQLEEGTTATAFEQRLYGQELALCQRYFYKLVGGGSGNLFPSIGSGQSQSATVALVSIPLPVTMRSSATASYNGFVSVNSGGVDYAVTSLGILYGYGSGQWVTLNVSGGGMTTGRGCIAYCASATTDWFQLSSEL